MYIDDFRNFANQRNVTFEILDDIFQFDERIDAYRRYFQTVMCK